MVSSSEVRVVCPSISFFFARLGASLVTSHTFFPLVGNFVFEDSGLNIVLGELFPVLSQSINWFQNLVGKRVRMSEVRSSNLETELSSSNDLVEGNTVVSAPQEVRAFHALDEVCSLDNDILARWPKLKSRYKERIEKAIEYSKTIEDFDDLVDPQTLSFYCLGLDSTAFVLHTPGIEAKEKVLGESLHLSLKFLTKEARVESAISQVAALEVENSKLKKDLITSMNEANVAKEKAKTLNDDIRVKRQLTLENDEQLLAAKEKIKTVAAKAVEAFQQTDEYNTMLFSWYFKGFELLRRYLVKHPYGVDLDSLTLKRWINKWSQMRLPTLRLLKVMPPRAPFLLRLVMTQRLLDHTSSSSIFFLVALCFGLTAFYLQNNMVFLCPVSYGLSIFHVGTSMTANS
ncbi:hypothetical protein SO802_015620 [Lithocarpus litseifolius]|uniref:Uncharacterized protein n=1 Tax=Lithocarpus litseifolius TaxID=425828 RepID=A0AAW2CWK1_9ROSI